MSTELLGLVIATVGILLCVTVAVGIPAIAVTAMKFFKYKERELSLEMEYRQKSEQNQEKQLAIEQRVQCLEETVTRLDHDVREHLGIGEPVTPSRPELFEASAAPEDTEAAAPTGNRVR